MEQLASYFLWFLFYSVLGWVWETSLYSVTQRHFVNRGFLNGPYCPIYGVGAVVDVMALGWISNPIALFLTGAILASIIEYTTSYAMEYYFHARWWDYSEKPFNLNGRICLEGAVVFGLFGLVLLKVVQPRVAAVTADIASNVLVSVAAILAIVFFYDVVYTVAKIYKLRSKLEAMRELMKGRVDAEIERMRLDFDMRGERLRIELNAQEQRMLKAFPAFKATLPSLTIKGKERQSLLKLWRPQRISINELLEKQHRLVDEFLEKQHVISNELLEKQRSFFKR